MRLIAHNDGRELRGSERQLLHLARGLSARGHTVLVSCRAGGDLERALRGEDGGSDVSVTPVRPRDDVSVTPVRPRGDVALGSALAFRRLIAERRSDAVLLTSWKRLFVGSWAARSAGAPRIVARLGIVRRLPVRGWSGWKLRRALERVDLVVVNSEAVRTALLESAPSLAADRVRVIRNGVAALRGDPEKLRREVGLEPSMRLIASVAALEPRKGIDLLLRALALLPADVHAAIAGEGPEAARLRALAGSLSLDRRVHWLGRRSDVGDVLAASQAFVLPSRQDSVPNALLEAMAAGVPVVTTAGNGAEEALAAVGGRGAAGWIAPAEDPAALAGSIEAALASPADPAAEARWRAETWFGVERMVEEYERALFGG